MEVSSAGTPHFALTITSLIQGVPVETRTSMLFAVDRTYSVAFVATPRQHVTNASWERAVVDSVHLAKPATYDPTYVEEPSAGTRIADRIGRYLGGAIFILAIFLAARYANKRSAAQMKPSPMELSAQEKPTKRPEWWERP